MTTSARDLTRLLRELQVTDLELLKLGKEAARWPDIIASRKAESDARKRKLDEHEDSRKAARREIDKKELELKSVENEIYKLNVQLNSVKTNREYTALLNEIAMKKASVSKIEEEIIGRLDAVEEAVAEVASARAVYDSALKELEKVEKQAAAERSEIEGEAAQLRKRRDEQAAGIPADVLTHYERIARSRDGLALVGVIDGVCQGCFINLTAQEINLLMAGDKINTCRNCSRILVLEN